MSEVPLYCRTQQTSCMALPSHTVLPAARAEGLLELAQRQLRVAALAIAERVNAQVRGPGTLEDSFIARDPQLQPAIVPSDRASSAELLACPLAGPQELGIDLDPPADPIGKLSSSSWSRSSSSSESESSRGGILPSELERPPGRFQRLKGGCGSRLKRGTGGVGQGGHFRVQKGKKTKISSTWVHGPRLEPKTGRLLVYRFTNWARCGSWSPFLILLGKHVFVYLKNPDY